MAVTAQARAPQVDATIAELKKLYGDRVSTAHAVREQHGKDISFHEAHLPDAVVFAELAEEVQQIVQLCARHKTPIIAFGTGTSLEGHISAPNGGISLDVSRMNKVLAVNEADLDVVVQPGVTRKQLNEYIRATGLFFPIDPGADASLGGMTSTRASGTNAVRYGTMRENVLSLQVVTADGRLMRLGRRSRKSSAGYDLVKLFVGSEGTLGIITEITLRLYGIPESMVSATCAFDSLEGAVNTVIQTIQSGIPVARIELMDTETVDTVNKYSKLSLPLKSIAAAGVPRHRGRHQGAGRDGAGASPPTTAAATSPGPARPRSAARCGRRATTRHGPPRPPGRAGACGRPTSACRSRGSPNASSRRRRTSSRAASTRRSSAMSATATSISP